MYNLIANITMIITTVIGDHTTYYDNSIHYNLFTNSFSCFEGRNIKK